MEEHDRSQTTTSNEGNAFQERRSIRFMSGMYGVALVVLAIVGITAPDVFIRNSEEMITNTVTLSSPESTYVFDKTDYKRAHQSIYLSMRLNIPRQLLQAMESDNTSVYEGLERFNISVFGSPQDNAVTSDSCSSGCIQCPDGHEPSGLECNLIADKISGTDRINCASDHAWCSWLPLYNLNFVFFKTYYFTVDTENDLSEYTDGADTDSIENWVAEFQAVFVSQWYTLFEMVWFYFWCVATLLVMFMPRFGFFASSWRKGIPWGRWSRQQKWIGVLLVALFFFDNPFFAAQIFSDYPRAFFIWFSTAEGVLVGLLMMYWLDRLFGFGQNPNRDRSKERLPQLAQFILTGFVCFIYILNMIHIRLARQGDPGRIHKYPDSSSGLEKILAMLCFVYCIWVVLLCARASWYCVGDRETTHRSPRMMFFGVASAVTMVVLLPSVILEHLTPRTQGGIAFSMAHGTINLYILTIALLCAPGIARPPLDVVTRGEEKAEDDVLRQPSWYVDGGFQEGTEGPSTRSESPKWWQGKSRQRIAGVEQTAINS